MPPSAARTRVGPALRATVTAVEPRFVTLLTARHPGEDPVDVTQEGEPPAMRVTLRFGNGRVDQLRILQDDIELSREK